jgi:ubiquinone/menaquinone biosynthesis C-methylase UbiE
MTDSRSSHLWKQTSQAHFKRWADHYDQDIINVLLFRPSIRKVLEKIRHLQRRGLENMRILDIGCGTGNLALYSFNAFDNINNFVGLDMSENMIEKAHNKAKLLNITEKLQFTIGDAEHLPFDDNSFNIVTCCHSFHHYPHKDRAIAEMHRVLENQGHLMLIDGSRDDPWGYFIFEVCVSYIENHVHHCTDQLMAQMLRQAGFDDIQQNVFGVCPPALLNVARANK